MAGLRMTSKQKPAVLKKQKEIEKHKLQILHNVTT
jgi:hypothetical protein